MPRILSHIGKLLMESRAGMGSRVRKVASNVSRLVVLSVASRWPLWSLSQTHEKN